MPIEKLKPTFSLEVERLEALKQIVPEVFADGMINWETLKETLAPFLEDESEDAEHFGLNWPGKRQARRLASIPSKGTLLPVPGEGVNEGNTQNIFIESDNLEALKLLQKSYAGRIKMIYIDPPYNTGNDFIYKDDYSEPLESYRKRTGQADEEGKLLVSNTKADGRFHSNWLNMIWPRLRLARNLLREDGVIFVSIDENEGHNLRLVMDEIFGMENFQADIAWQRKYAVSNNFKGIASIKESILIYSRSESFENGLLPRSEESKARYANPDNDPRGPWKPVDYWNQASPEQRPNLVYPITNPNTREVVMPDKKAWKYSRDVHERHVAENRIWWGMSGKNRVPALKLFLSEVRDGMIPHDWWQYEEVGHTDEAKKELDALFTVAPFDTPKPTRLIKRMLQVANVAEGDIILDFFAGSGTTGHAIYDQNRSDGITRNFILVQIPEPISHPELTTLAEVVKERLRRAILKLKAENEQGLFDEGNKSQDQGFRVMKLGESSFKAWRDVPPEADLPLLQATFETQRSPLADGWKEVEVLTEVLLIEGFPLHSAVTQDESFLRNKVFRVESDFCAHRIFISLDADVMEETIRHVAELPKEDIFICLDSALSDTDKTTLDDNHPNTKTI